MATKRMRTRALVLAASAAALTALTTVTATGTAWACGPSGRSDGFAKTLPQVRPHQRGTTVLGLQLNLKKRGYPLVGTGYYGSDTLRAVKDFQHKHHIKASGIVGSKTWHALVGTLSKSGTSRAEYPRATLRPGSHNRTLIFELSNALMRIPPYDNGDLPVGEQVYGASWQRLVRDFQHRDQRKATGTVDSKTWHDLDRVISIEGNWGC